LKSLIDHVAQTVTSSTGELSLNYGKGVLTINAASAQGVSGLLKGAGRAETKDLRIESEMELGHIVVVSLDDKPLSTSEKMLLQVMSEEMASGFQTESMTNGVKRIVNIGTNPWMVKELSGTVTLKRSDAGGLRVTALDFNGYPVGSAGAAIPLKLKRDILYYVISK
jgi:hypothetical protein